MGGMDGDCKGRLKRLLSETILNSNQYGTRSSVAVATSKANSKDLFLRKVSLF